MRQMTVLLILATAFAGCEDSAAAMVVISAPVMAKNTLGTAAMTAIQPFGVKPPCSVRLPSVEWGEVMPNTNNAASSMNTRIAATLIEANQNSNSAYERADMRLTAVMAAMSVSPIGSRPTPGNHS